MSVAKEPPSILSRIPQDVMRYGIAPFREECEYITNVGARCKPFDNRFITNSGKRKECSWYCLSQCNPQQLLPLFAPPKNVQINEQIFSVTSGSMNIYGSSSNLTIFFRNDNVKLQVSEYRRNNNPSSIETFDSASRILCEFIRNNIHNLREITFHLGFSKYDPGFGAGPMYVKFDHPYVRPETQWTLYRDYEFPGLELSIDAQTLER